VAFKEEIEGENIMLLNNGCMCCTVRTDLVKLLNILIENRHKDTTKATEPDNGPATDDMAQQQRQESKNGSTPVSVSGGHFDHLIIETTGLAHPMPIIGTFLTEESIAEAIRLDGVVTMVDACHVMKHIDQQTDEVIEQIAYADKIIVNKVDLFEAQQQKGEGGGAKHPLVLDDIARALRAINPLAAISFVERGGVDPRSIVTLGGFDLAKVPEDLRQQEEHNHSHNHDHEHDHDHHHHDHEHDHHHHHDHGDVTSVSLSFPGSLDLEQINDWMGFFLTQRSEDVYRMKGILSIHQWEEKFIFQGVHAQFEGIAGALWKPDETRSNKIVFIGKKLNRDEMEREIKACLVA